MQTGGWHLVSYLRSAQTPLFSFENSSIPYARKFHIKIFKAMISKIFDEMWPYVDSVYCKASARAATSLLSALMSIPIPTISRRASALKIQAYYETITAKNYSPALGLSFFRFTLYLKQYPRSHTSVINNLSSISPYQQTLCHLIALYAMIIVWNSLD